MLSFAKSLCEHVWMEGRVEVVKFALCSYVSIEKFVLTLKCLRRT